MDSLPAAGRQLSLPAAGRQRCLTAAGSPVGTATAAVVAVAGTPDRSYQRSSRSRAIYPVLPHHSFALTYAMSYKQISVFNVHIYNTTLTLTLTITLILTLTLTLLKP